MYHKNIHKTRQQAGGLLFVQYYSMAHPCRDGQSYFTQKQRVASSSGDLAGGCWFKHVLFHSISILQLSVSGFQTFSVVFFLFTTEYCGVLVFRLALPPRSPPPPPPPPPPRPLCHTQTLSHTNFVTHKFVTHKFVTYKLSHTNCHTQLCHIQIVTHNFVTHNFVTQTHTHTQKKNVTYNCHTHNFVTYNFVTYNLSHTNLSHTTLSHTNSHIQIVTHTQLCHIQIVTHNFVTHTHTNLSHTHFVTRNFVTHTTLAGVALRDILRRFTWQARHLATSTFVCVAGVVLIGLGWVSWRAWAPLGALWSRGNFCVAGVSLRDILRRFTWQARHLATSTFVLRGRRGLMRLGWGLVTRLGAVGRRVVPRPFCGRLGTSWHPPSFHVAGKALGDIHLRFAWQAWYLWDWAEVWWRAWALRPFCVAGVALRDILRRFTWQAWHLATSTFVLCGRPCAYWHTQIVTHHLSHTPFSTHIFVTHHLSHTSWLQPSFTHIFVRHHLSYTTLSHTIFHTHLCHTPSFTHILVTTIFHTHLCQTPSFIHNVVTHHFPHTSLLHTIFHKHLGYTPSLSHPLPHTHTTFPHHCHTPSFTHNLFTYNLFTHRSSTTSLVYPAFPVPLQLSVLIIGRNWLVRLSGPLFHFQMAWSTWNGQTSTRSEPQVLPQVRQAEGKLPALRRVSSVATVHCDLMLLCLPTKLDRGFSAEQLPLWDDGDRIENIWMIYVATSLGDVAWMVGKGLWMIIR